jgi:hypothetical protein
MPGTYTVPDNPADPLHRDEFTPVPPDSLPPSVHVSRQRLCYGRVDTLRIMNPVGIQQISFLRHGKRLGAALGLTAAASMVALSIVSSDSGGQAGSVVAGSGAGSVGTFTHPAAPGMNVGATETPTTPASAPAVEKATPAIKAHG